MILGLNENIFLKGIHYQFNMRGVFITLHVLLSHQNVPEEGQSKCDEFNP
jgi:hypothetical protein